MSPERKKRFIVAAAAVIALSAGLVVADYFGAFGISKDSNTEFVEFNVRTVDAETGRKIGNVKVRCFQYTSNNACGQPPGREHGVVRISLLVEKHVKESLLFRKEVRYTPVNENELRVMFIHTEYQKPVRRYNIPELIEHPDQVFTVEMAPLVPAAERARQREADAADREDGT
ncbi:MAG: hypothetical protein U5P41_13465 [Gammaproteobacteria bacterium]|nr:hypothetical protein [Gammaproteobacteria bacterium]